MQRCFDKIRVGDFLRLIPGISGEKPVEENLSNNQRTMKMRPRMTVRELIEKLQEYDQNTLVGCTYNGYYEAPEITESVQDEQEWCQNDDGKKNRSKKELEEAFLPDGTKIICLGSFD